MRDAITALNAEIDAIIAGARRATAQRAEEETDVVEPTRPKFAGGLVTSQAASCSESQTTASIRWMGQPFIPANGLHSSSTTWSRADLE